MPREKAEVFICHASPDKEAVARPLAQHLARSGIVPWIDERDIEWGDSLTGRVNEGLSHCRYVIVILSRAFIDRSWPERELMAALNLEASTGTTRVLPLLAGNDQERQEIMAAYPLLNDKRYMRWPDDANQLVPSIQRLLGRETAESVASPNDLPAYSDIPIPRRRRQLTQLERDRFARETYDEIRRYFELGLRKLASSDSSIEFDIRDQDADHFACRVYASGDLLQQCRIWLGGAAGADGDEIFFAEGRHHATGHSYNESLMIQRDLLAWHPLNYGLYPEEMGDTGLAGPREAAEYLWRRFVMRLE